MVLFQFRGGSIDEVDGKYLGAVAVGICGKEQVAQKVPEDPGALLLAFGGPSFRSFAFQSRLGLQVQVRADRRCADQRDDDGDTGSERNPIAARELEQPVQPGWGARLYGFVFEESTKVLGQLEGRGIASVE